MRNYKAHEQYRIMSDDIVSGRDEMGVLLMGHDYKSWWIVRKSTNAANAPPIESRIRCSCRRRSPEAGNPRTPFTDPIGS